MLNCLSLALLDTAGLVPFNRDSGTLNGTRAIWGGRASVRRALYMGLL
ncbi:transposase [Legionella massiliensis]